MARARAAKNGTSMTPSIRKQGENRSGPQDTLSAPSMFQVYNSLTKRKEPFRSLEPGVVRMYNCGPTVYGRAHIGNFRSYLFADTLRRWLEYRGYRVLQVMNITDVGHLTDDADDGEDKIE